MKSTLRKWTLLAALTSNLILVTVLAQTNRSVGAKGSWVYVGTRGAPPKADAPASEVEQYQASPQGIYAMQLDAESGKLTPMGLQIPLPGVPWLLAHPTLPVIYTFDIEGGQTSPNNVYSFAVDVKTGKLQELNKVTTGAPDATHLTLDVKSRTLFSAGYGDGDVTAFPIQADGSIGPAASNQKDFGVFNNPPASPRQQTVHAHSVAIDPTGRYVFSADFGADRLFIYRFDPTTRKLSRADPPYIEYPPASAPRHLAFHPNGKFLYMNTELSGELYSYTWDSKLGRLTLIERLSLYPPDYAGTSRSTAELLTSKDGRFMYVSLRGDDSIAVYTLNSSSGTAKEIQRIHSPGKTPWSIAIDPTGRWMVVVNSASKEANVMKVDGPTGKLTLTSVSVPVPTPDTVVLKAK